SDISLLQRLVYTAVTALIYEVDGTRPRLVRLACREEWDPASGCPACPEDLDTDPWFVDPQAVQAIDYLPGTRCRLANGYAIITMSRDSRRSGMGQPNMALQRLFSVEWPGTVMIVKRGRRHRARAVNLTPPEVSLINAVVHR
ncbi:hypothetical protein FKP32DRAFT_1560089, partial [Trametes sanguinea]